jgi:hypothetical protein
MVAVIKHAVHEANATRWSFDDKLTECLDKVGIKMEAIRVHADLDEVVKAEEDKEHMDERRHVTCLPWSQDLRLCVANEDSVDTYS